MATFDVGIIITAVNNAKATFANVNRDLKKTETQAKKTTKGLRAIQVVMAAIALGAGIQFAKTIVKIVGEMELLLARLSQVEGGMTAARAMLKKIVNEFSQTPFAIDAVANGFTRLRAAGLSTKDAFETLRAGVDAVAAFGGSTQELNRFIIGLQQSIGKGTLSMEELRQQIGEAVPSAMRVLAREMDISIGELFTRIESGSVESLKAVKLLTKGLQDDFGGFANTLGNKILGAMQGAQSRIKVALEEMFNVDTDAGSKTVEFIREMEKSIIDFIKSITQQDVDRFFVSLENGVRIVGEIINLFTMLLGIVGDVFVGISGLVNVFDDFFSASEGNDVSEQFKELRSEVADSEKFIRSLMSSLGAGAVLGLIGLLVFGGPAGAVIAAIAAVSAALGQVSSENNAGEALIKNFDDRLVKQIGEGGVAAATKFVDTTIATLENRSIGSQMADFVLGRSDIIEDLIAKAKAAREALGDTSSELFKSVSTAAEAASKKMAVLVQLISRVTADTAVKLRRLVDQAETGTFNFGSKTAEKLRRKLDKLLPVIEQFRKKVADFDKATAGRDLTKQESSARRQADKELKSIEADIKAINDAIAKGEAVGLEKFMKKTETAFKRVSIGIDKFGQKLAGDDGLRGKILGVENQFNSLALKMQKVIDRQIKANDSAGVAKSNAELQRAADIRDRIIMQLNEQHAIQTKIFSLQQQSARLSIGKDTLDLAREGRSGLQQSFASSFEDQATDRKFALLQGILSTQEKIKTIEASMKDASEERKAEMKQTINRLGEFVSAQQQALESTSAAGLLAKEVWKDVGDTIQSSVKTAMGDLVKGTFDAEKALLSFYDKITDSAINYLFELIKIQFQQQLLAGFSSGTSGSGSGFGGIFSSLFGQGNVKPFAAGDIIRGPTMFGMAGEAGTEAIMPLTRVGGQLGVRAEGGGGGDSFEIHIHAIDTQTGAKFLRDNSDQIVQQVRQANKLNKGLGASR